MRLSTRQSWVASIALACVALVAYSTSFAGVFVFDDFANIVENPHVRSLWPPGPALWANPGLGLHGRPVVAFTFALDRALWGAQPLGFHVTNLAIHVLASLALYFAARRALSATKLSERFGPHAHGLALAIALTWVAHPLNSSAVTYVVQRCESLMGAFFLLAFYAAQRAFDERSTRWVIVAAVASALGAGCKEVIAVLPLVVLAYDVALRGRTVREALASDRKLYLALASVWLVVASLVVWSGGHARSVGAGVDIDAWAYLRTQCVALVDYLRLAFWPRGLNFDYGWPVPRSTLAWLVPGALVLALLIATVFALARRQAIGFAGAWFFLILAPSSSILPITTELVAEHRMYLPLAAVVALVVLGAYVWLAKAPRFVAPILVACVTVGLALATRARNREYESEERLWRSVLAVAPDNPRAHDSLGDELRRQGKQDQAREHFAEAVRLQPNAAFWRNNYGSSLSAAGDLDGALEQWREAVRLDPDFAIARANLGRALYAKSDLSGALEHLSAALRLKPNLTAAYKWLGFTLADLDRTQEAIPYLRAAIAADPRDAAVQERLGKLSSPQPPQYRSIRRE